MARAKVKGDGKRYVLTLSETEARFLGALVGNHVIGRGKWRRCNAAIYDALVDAGAVDYSPWRGDGVIDVSEED